jgi:hypothetical protein
MGKGFLGLEQKIPLPFTLSICLLERSFETLDQPIHRTAKQLLHTLQTGG